MKSIHKQENDIFEEYQLANNQIVPDGLHYLGELYYEERVWKRKEGDEEKRWGEACSKKRGLVVLTKELNDEEAWDIRAEHGRKQVKEPTTCIKYAFYRNLRCWIYGLLNMSKEGLMPEYPTNPDIPQKCFETYPWVRMNLKKTIGNSSINNSSLDRFIEEHESLLLKQLSIYKDASIYLDCAAGRGKTLLKKIYSDIKAFEEGNWIYVSKEHRFIVINSYHPSHRIPDGEKAYYGSMRDALKSFFNENSFF